MTFGSSLLVSRKELFNRVAVVAILSTLIKLVLSPGDDSADILKTLSYICDISILICCAITAMYWRTRDYLVIFVAAAFLIIHCLNSFVYSIPISESLSSSIRIIAPFLFGSMLVNIRVSLGTVKVLGILTLAVILVCTIYGFYYFPPSVNRFTGTNEGLWWPAYFSGLHTTTYVFVAGFLIIHALLGMQLISKFFYWICFVIALGFVSFGWGVRTTSVSLLVLLAMYLYERYLRNLKTVSSVVFGLGTFLLVIYFAFAFDFSDVDQISSGRLSMYEFKVNQLLDNSIYGWMFGNGAGSDVVETDFWWWEAKGAHNDFLTVMVEMGLFGFLMYGLLLKWLYETCKFAHCTEVFWAIIATSLISNGFLVRPLAMYIAIFAVVALFQFRRFHVSL